MDTAEPDPTAALGRRSLILALVGAAMIVCAWGIYCADQAAWHHDLDDVDSRIHFADEVFVPPQEPSAFVPLALCALGGAVAAGGCIAWILGPVKA